MTEILKKGFKKAPTVNTLAIAGTIALLGVMPGSAPTSAPATLSADGTPLSITSSPPVDYSVSESLGTAVIEITQVSAVSALSLDATAVPKGPPATLTVSNLVPNASYHLYQDSVVDHKKIKADNNGKYSFNVDSEDTTFYALTTATVSGWIVDDATGGDCTQFGIWNAMAKTCTMTADTEGTMQIMSDGVTLDGNGHTITAFNQAIFINGHSNVVIRNVRTAGNGTGILVRSSNFVVIEDNTVETIGSTISGATRIDFVSVNQSIIRNNTVSTSLGTCISLGGSGGAFFPSPSVNAYNVVEGNTISGCGNGIYGNVPFQPTIRNNTITGVDHGLGLSLGGGTISGNILTGVTHPFSFGSLYDGSEGFDIPDTNIADGKPLIFRVDLEDQVITQPLAAFVCRNCVRTTLQGVTITSQGTGAVFSGGEHNRIDGVHFVDGVYGAFIHGSPAFSVINSDFTNTSYQLYAFNSPNGVIDGTLFRGATYGSFLQLSDGAQFLNSTFEGPPGGMIGIYADQTLVTTSRNVFIGMTRPLFFTSSAFQNVALSPEEGGGNYYDIYDEPAEGCADTNNDKFCDAPLTFQGGQDQYPWAMANAWEEPPTDFLSDGAVNRPKGVADKDEFNFTVTYAHPDNLIPTSINTIIGATNLPMHVDPSAPIALRDGNFTNGEQFITDPTTFAKDIYTFSFEGVTSGTPFSLSDPSFTFQTGYSSIIFLPGIKGSRLFHEKIGPDDELWFPNTQFSNDVRQLAMDGSGDSITSDVYVNGLLESVFGVDVYESFKEDFLDSVQPNLVAETVSFPYDWRFDVRDIVLHPVPTGSGSYSMGDRLGEIANRSDSGKVTIISHSMGGLVGKVLMTKLAEEGRATLVEKFIMVATPQLGTPDAIAAILHGHEQGIFPLVSSAASRFSSQNMLGAFSLMPLGAYNLSAPPIVTFSTDPFAVSTQKFRDEYGPAIDSAQELQNFLSGTWATSLAECSDPDSLTLDEPICQSTLLLNVSKQTRQILEDWTPPAGLEVFEFAGTNRPTISTINYKQKGGCNPVVQGCVAVEPLPHGEGDGTVMVSSAQAQNGATSYVMDMSRFVGFSHRALLNIPEVQDILSQLITTSSPSLSAGIQPKGTLFPVRDFLVARSLSPVVFELRDSLGNVTKTENNPDLGIRLIQEDVPDSQYFSVGDTQMIIVPANQTYALSILGTGTGYLQLEFEQYENNVLTAERIHESISVTPNLTSTFTFTNVEEIGDIPVDTDGDGQIDVTLKPKTAEDVLQELKSYISSFTLNNGLKTALLAHVNNIERTVQAAGQGRKFEAQIASFRLFVQIYHKLGLLSEEESSHIEILIIEFEGLLDN